MRRLRGVKIHQSTGSDSNFSRREMPPFLRFFARWSFPALCLCVVSAGNGGYSVLWRAIGGLARRLSGDDANYIYSIAL